MTPLRQRMLDAMQVRGFAQRTQECYCEAIARMARHKTVSDPLGPITHQRESSAGKSICGHTQKRLAQSPACL